MKLHAAGVFGAVAMAMLSAGCLGPGLSHQGKWAAAPAPPESAVGTTLISSDTRLLAHSLDPAPWDEPSVTPASPTWGAAAIAEPEPAPAAEPAASSPADPHDLHPYD